MAVESPFEILELPDGGQLFTHVSAFEEGSMAITPRDGRPAKVVRTVRIHVPPAEKAHFPFYWDLTAQTLIAQLLPMLPSIVKEKRAIKITKSGLGASARFSLEVRP